MYEQHPNRWIRIDRPKQEAKETQKNNLRLLKKEVDALWLSLRSGEPESIKTIHLRLLDEQHGRQPNPLLIDQLKAKLMGAYRIHQENLSNLAMSNLPSDLERNLQNQGIDLKRIFTNTFHNINELTKQDLTINTSLNKFRLDAFIEQVNKIQIAINNIN